jgi:hypothetical protein
LKGPKLKLNNMFLNEQNEAQSLVFASIANGKIVVRTTLDDPKGTKRINKQNKEVSELFYTSIFGKITSIEVKTNIFDQEQILITINNGERNALLSFNRDSAYGRDFFQQIFNVDFTKNVIFTPWSKVFEDGSKRTKLYLSYSKYDKVLAQYPEGTPEIKWVETKKGSVVDPQSKDAHDTFLDEKLSELISKFNLESLLNSESSSKNFPLSNEEKERRDILGTNPPNYDKPNNDDEEDQSDWFNSL